MSKCISIDLSVTNTPYPTGIARYAHCLLLAMVQALPTDWRLLTFGRSSPLVHSPVVEHVPSEFPVNDIVAFRKYLSVFLHLEAPDCHFSPYYPLPDIATCPTVLTFHDLLPLRHPEWFPNRKTRDFFDGPLRESASSSSQLIADSAATRNDLTAIYGIPENRITVVPLASTLAAFPEAPIRSPAHPRLGKLLSGGTASWPFVLLVGSLEPRKNLVRQLAAFAAVLERHPELPHHCILAGPEGWKLRLPAQLLEQLQERVHFTGYLPDAQLSSLYSQTSLFLFASLAEGFGLPLLEAMTHGRPAITSRNTSLPEIGGDAVLYANPEETADIALKIEQILLSNDLSTRLGGKSRQRAANFSWERTARATLQVIARAMGAKLS